MLFFFYFDRRYDCLFIKVKCLFLCLICVRMRYMNVGPEVPDEIQLCSSVHVSLLFNLVCLYYSFYLCVLSEK